MFEIIMYIGFDVIYVNSDCILRKLSYEECIFSRYIISKYIHTNVIEVNQSSMNKFILTHFHLKFIRLEYHIHDRNA